MFDKIKHQILKESDCFLLTHGDDLTGSRTTSTMKICQVADIIAYGDLQDLSIHCDELSSGGG